jgi:transposase
MQSTEIVMPQHIFKFSGQTDLNVYPAAERAVSEIGLTYSKELVHEIPRFFLQIKSLVGQFPFWCHEKGMGRPRTSEATLLIGFLLRQYFDLPFRQTEGMLLVTSNYFEIEHVPDFTVFSRSNNSRKWVRIWKRFFKFVLERFPDRNAIIATDATGYSGRKIPWRQVDYGLKASQNWVKVHAAIETETFVVLNYEISRSNVHESKRFEEVWKNLPPNVTPIRSLADSAYLSKHCLGIALMHGAKPYHQIKSNSKLVRQPRTDLQRLVYFANRFPNRYKNLKANRNHVETGFSMIDRKVGYRIKSRSWYGRVNEVQAKYAFHNIMQLPKEGNST